MWLCSQHGDKCESYVKEIVNSWNKKGYTLKNLPEDEKVFLKCVVWVSDITLASGYVACSNK